MAEANESINGIIIDVTDTNINIISTTKKNEFKRRIYNKIKKITSKKITKKLNTKKKNLFKSIIENLNKKIKKCSNKLNNLKKSKIDF